MNNRTIYSLIADQLDNIVQLLYQSHNLTSTDHQIALALDTIKDLLQQLT